MTGGSFPVAGRRASALRAFPATIPRSRGPGVFAALVVILGLPPAGLAAEAPSPERGAELFREHCAACHGLAAAGQSAERPAGGFDEAGNRLAPALNGTGHAWHHPPELLFRYIEQGSVDASSPMPAFGDRLDETEIESIVAYIRSLWPERILLKYRERFGDALR